MNQADRIALLETDELAKVRVAVDDLVAHGTPDEWNELVRGFQGDGGLTTSSKRGPLRCAEARLRWRLPTVLALIGAAPDGTDAAAMRASITRVHLSGSRIESNYATPQPGQMAPLDIGPLARFPSLTQISVEYTDDLRGLDEALGAPALLGLWLTNVSVASLDLSRARSLVELRLSRLASLRSLTGLPATLRNLHLYSLSALTAISLGAAQGVESLHLHETPALPRPAAHLSRLTELRCDLHDGPWLAELTSLTSAWVWQTQSVAPFAGLKALEVLEICATDAPLELVPLALPALRQLEIVYAKKLTTLAGLAGGSLPAVRTLTLRGNDALTTLDGLESAPGVTKAEVQGDAIVDISALAAWGDLEGLALRCPVLTDIRALAGLTKLKRLSIEHCRQLRDLGPLAALGLERLVCSDSGATKTSIPEVLHKVVHPPSLVAKSKPRAARGAKPVLLPAAGGARQTLAKLKKLLLTRDWDTMNQGLELLRSLDDAALYEGLLSGSTIARVPLETEVSRWHWNEARELMPGAYDVVTPNALLAYAKPLRPYRESLLRSLVAQAPAGSPTAEALRAGWRHIVCTGAGSSYTNGPVDLEPLAGLPNLVAAVVLNAAELVNLDALARAAKLEALALLRVQGRELHTLASPSLKRLVLVYPNELRRAPDFAAFPSVERLVFHVSDALDDIKNHFPRLAFADVSMKQAAPLLASFARSPLEHLVLRSTGDARVFAPLASTPTLTDLEINYGEDMPDLSPLAALTSLRRLTLRRCAPTGVGALAGLPNLETLEIWRSTLRAADLDALATMPSLKHLRFDGEVKLEAPLPPTLAALVEKARP